MCGRYNQNDCSVSKCESFNQNANITCELVEVVFVRIGPWGLLH